MKPAAAPTVLCRVAELSPDEQQRLESLNDLYYESVSMHSYASFEYGYRLGALLMVETLTGIDELNPSEILCRTRTGYHF